jgi:hypothetical protein
MEKLLAVVREIKVMDWDRPVTSTSLVREFVAPLHVPTKLLLLANQFRVAEFPVTEAW